MTSVIYLGIMLLMKFIQSICSKKTSNALEGKQSYMHYGAFQYLVSGALAFVLILFSGSGIKTDLLTLVISFISALSLLLCTFCSLAAMKSGTLTLTTLFGSAGLLVPCIAGIFMFRETMSVMQYVGILMFLVSAYLLIGASRQVYTNFSFKTVLLLLGSLLGNGVTMLAQKMFAYYVPDGDVSSFSFLSFGSLGIVLLAAFFISSAVEHEKPQPLPKKLMLYGVALAGALFVLNQLSTLAADMIPSVILFTVVNGGGTVITAVVAAVFFNERLTVKSSTGILIGLAALLAINIF